ncbi:type II toxin-antitoxin system VapC family toxin [Caulobacter vibrioides]|uniref:type II toxin-antitoxin system VapC family toxin n=1 Tax=Caulobacter vibrioides TaxID=155892 RepID=UPI000BB4D60B|nr:type II toxin-antitoxin system VapC family toxin [Caulobacter vibrioides]ATC23609.1 twitching motility protein PilT [Caulobacter vibrioides]PLR11798.1 twitching motility protein PilT [Caulobacter vibrioides]
MFVDASAWVAIILREPERERFRMAIADAEAILTSPLAIWETVRAATRETKDPVDVVRARLMGILASIDARIVAIGAEEGRIALDAHARFGKGVHPARLNMGDCFSYACAKVHGVPLLYKGEDFALTDIEAA